MWNTLIRKKGKRETMKKELLFTLAFALSLLASSLHAFQSEELLVDDEEFGLEGAPLQRSSPDSTLTRSSATPSPTAAAATTTTTTTSSTTTTSRRKFSDPDSDSKIQFPLEHAFGDSDFVPAGTFSARLKTWNHGGQTLTKLRFSRNDFSELEKEKFEKLLEADEFYKIRLPSNVLSPPGRDYVISSVRARCLTRDGLDEHFVINMEGVHVLAVNYGSPGACAYPRQLKLPAKWSFNSRTILKNSEQAPRTPIFAEVTLGGENGEGELIPPPERSFLAKYWMYLIPLGIIVMNTMSQAMNVPEEQATGQPGAPAVAATQRAPSSAVRRR